ncbi:MAG: uroporphyrinogen-III C-methyltransferase, partial [bacterium]
LECLQQAELVVYDYLANEELLNWVKNGAEVIYVGKKAGEHTFSQGQINQLLVDKANEGKVIVRLKGGDPFVFGRGGEEAEFLVENGIDFEVVPGVTSAVAVPAYAGIPLTHRKYTSLVTIITGHEALDKSSLPGSEIAKVGGTLVILMGTSKLEQIINELINNGLNGQTPIAVIYSGTLSDQKTITGTLNNIVEKIHRLKPPTISIIGEVVNLRQSLNWFEKKPLFGKKILITRTREQASELSKLLKTYGASVVEFPVIKIVLPVDVKKLDNAITQLDTYDWIIFTSVNGVKYFFNQLRKIGKDIRELKGLKIAAIGPATNKMLRDLELNVDYQPEEEWTQEGLIEGFKKFEMRGKRVLVPRSEEARQVLIEGLKEMEAQVDDVAAYRTIKEESDVGYLKELLSRGEIDIITFTSSSTVTNFCCLFNKEEINHLLNKVKIASIGPITTQKAQALGLKVDITAKEYTIKGLVKAILKAELPLKRGVGV